VHREHGIAKLTKTTTQTIDGISREYFLLQYKDNDRLYLPIEQANKISKYLGANKPKLHRLGAASTWPQVVRKLKEDIIKTAQELLNLYARRQLSQAKPLRPHPLEETVWPTIFLIRKQLISYER
jgi:transcription-repair coupling factor (superfamily II helicase)